MDGSKQTFKASEFARRAGVTVRTLHHYDRLGLLKPSGRTVGGYRLYIDSDLVRLEQIVALKFIGFSLSQIKDVLHRDPDDLVTTLRLQREIMVAKRRHVQRAIEAIEFAERACANGSESGADAGPPSARRFCARWGAGCLAANHRGDRNAEQHGLEQILQP